MPDGTISIPKVSDPFDRLIDALLDAQAAGDRAKVKELRQHLRALYDYCGQRAAIAANGIRGR
jgi:hypothetical protein